MVAPCISSLPSRLLPAPAPATQTDVTAHRQHLPARAAACPADARRRLLSCWSAVVPRLAAHGLPCCRASQPLSAWHARRRYRCLTAAAMNGNGAQAAEAAPEEGLQGFGNRHLEEFSVAVLGDLHLEPDQMHHFTAARAQLRDALAGPSGQPLPGARVVSLGDLGGYSHAPGSAACFAQARSYLDGFALPTAAVLGNHDLEGAEFETDEANLACWQQTMRQRHYWKAELGPAVLLGLSTVRFRSNVYSVHEVHVDAEQMAWFERRLAAAAAAQRPVIVFTHAPPMGCGLKVVQEVHVKNRCAWLNHSGADPAAFLRLVEAHPNIRLWFSGHFHLSHNYTDSISAVGGCAFVLAGVIGDCNRDGFRHTRLLRGNADGYELYTVDHEGGGLRLDLAAGWRDAAPPRPVTPEDELICDPQAGWLCSQLDCDLPSAGPPGTSGAAQGTQWWAGGGECMLARQGRLLVEYNATMRAAVGIVCLDLREEEIVSLVDASGAPVGGPGDDGASAVALELRDSATGAVRRLPRNAAGGFYQIFQQNKWRARKAREQAERRAMLQPA